jgi:hypothetical protein
MMKPARRAAAATLLALAGCSHPMKIGRFANTTPPFDPIAFWTGHTTSWGVVENRAGAPTEIIRTDCQGTPEPGGLHLRQTLVESDGTTRHRDWHLHRTPDGHYTASANDMSGPAYGTAAGRAFHWTWVWETSPGNPLKNVTMHQWMYLLDDGTMLNRTTITKLGVTVAQVSEVFTREK